MQHKGSPDYALAARLVDELPVPVILSGGLQDDERVLAAYEETGAAAVMLARGALGNPWLFSRVLGLREDEPTVDEVLAELDWVMDRAVEHLGAERAARYLRKFYPWYVDRLGAGREQQEALPDDRVDRRGAVARACAAGDRRTGLSRSGPVAILPDPPRSQRGFSHSSSP